MIKIGIVGYGNLGKSAEKVVLSCKDMTLVAVFSRRKVTSDLGTTVEDYSKMSEYINKIDVMLLCGGSASDIPMQGREIIKSFNTADSFDTHALLLDYYNDMDKLGREYGHISVIAAGWDPGLFSAMRLIFQNSLPDGDTYTFWGRGVSQGHSEAVRHISGVKYGIQYTVPKDEAINAIRKGERPNLSARQKHLRVCYVVAEPNADLLTIEKTITNMPNYFADYDTEVNFISEDEFLKNHTKMPHGGFVIRSGEVNGSKHTIEFSIKLEKNPDFTASILVSYARAAARLAEKGDTGARTIYEIPAILASDKPFCEVIKNLL